MDSGEALGSDLDYDLRFTSIGGRSEIGGVRQDNEGKDHQSH